MINVRSLLFAAAGMAAALPARAQEPTAPTKPPAVAAPAPKKSVDELIKALGSDSYRARLDAERSLREIGEAAVPQLKKAAESGDDAEVQWRSRRVLRQIERGSTGDLESRKRAEGGTDVQDPQQQPQQQPQDGQKPLTRRRAGARDPMRDQFESLFERFERDFGIDIPRARFFDDEFFRDLQDQMKSGTSRSQGMSIQIGPDGVRVEVQEKGEDGKSDSKVYEAPDMESFQQKYPGVLQKNGLGMGLFPGATLRGFAPGLQFHDGGQSQPHVWTIPSQPGQGRRQLPPANDEAAEPPSPPVGKRLGVSIQEIPAGVRQYLGLDEGTGLMVDSVSDGSLAQVLGLQKGDIVTHIGEHTIGSPQDVQAALAPIKKGASVEVRFVRKGETKTAKADKTEDTAAEPAEKPKSEPLQRRKAKGDETIR